MLQQPPGDQEPGASPPEPAHLIAGVTAASRAEHWAVDIRAGHHAVVADEPPGGGGEDAGPSPFGLLLSGLAACTVITLRMYADRKGWPLEGVDARLTYVTRSSGGHVDRHLSFIGALDDEQRDRLADIAERTPVTLVVKQGVSITTTVA